MCRFLTVERFSPRRTTAAVRESGSGTRRASSALQQVSPLTEVSGRGILALLSGLAEEERHRILKRANEGRVAAIKRGTKMGRTPKLDDHQQKEALKRIKAGESLRTIAKSYRVHHSTISRLAG